MVADLLLPSAVPCWSIPPSQCIKSSRLGRAPIRGVSGRRGVPLAVSQLAAAAADSPPGYLARGRKPRGTVILQPSADTVSLQQLLAVEQQQLQPDDVIQQQQQAGPGLDTHPGSALVMQGLLQHSLAPDDAQEREHPAALHARLSLAEHTQEQLQWQAQTELALQQAHPAQLQQQQEQELQAHLQQQQQHPQQQQHRALQQQHSSAVQQQPWRQLQQQAPQQQHRLAQHPQQQQQHPQQWQPQQGGAPDQQQMQQAWHQNGGRQRQQHHQQQRRLQGQLWQQNGHSQQVPQQQRRPPDHVYPQQQQWQQQAQSPGYVHGPGSVQGQPQQGFPPLQQRQEDLLWQQQRLLQQQASPSTSGASSSSSSSSSGDSSNVTSTSSTPSSSSSSRRGLRGSSAYSVIPATTAPSVAEASAAAAAAAAAAVAAAAKSRARQGRGGDTAAAAGAAGVQPLVPPAEECVPQAFWGLMNEELRPWHREVLVHLCYVLPPPACYIYRDMKPNRMQRVLAQRAMLEKALRGHLVELVHQDQQLQRWLKTLQARQPRVDKSINPDSVLQAQQELQNLKAALGRSRYSLHTLQDRAAAYSDRDYVQYSQTFSRLLTDLEDVAELQRSHAAPAVLQLQQLHDVAARRVLFARTEEAVVALHRETATRVQILLKAEQGLLDSSKQRLNQLRKEMQGFEWRYPPAPYIAWQFKGALKGARSPWTRTPGVGRREPKERQRGQQLQQPGAPPPLLGP